MGQKVHPHGIRLGIVKTWDAKWYAGDKDHEFAKNLHEDIKIRKELKNLKIEEIAVDSKNRREPKNQKQTSSLSISRVEIERSKDRIKLTIHTSKPGVLIGQGGQSIENIKNTLKKVTDKKIEINILEIRPPDLDATLVAENIAAQLERRIAFRRAMKQAVGRTMRSGAKGIKIMCSGRLGGAEIARSESYREGSIPLHTLRADIDYGFAEANTTYGRIGIKVWIFKGEILPDKKIKEDQVQPEGGAQNADA
ncbi:MAG: 30S ribosomal protein S3 [Selenomonadaceae bacterium]|nr:30S ribosomal protein S3 [Selenomonadaceae bacterium]